MIFYPFFLFLFAFLTVGQTLYLSMQINDMCFSEALLKISYRNLYEHENGKQL